MSNTCDICGKAVSSANMRRHLKVHEKYRYFCSTCHSFYTNSVHDLNYHIARRHAVESGSNSFPCTQCDLSFNTFYSLQSHRRSEHNIGNEGNSTSSSSAVAADETVDLRELSEGNEELYNELLTVRHFLKKKSYETGLQKIFNYPVTDYQPEVISSLIDDVYENIPCSVKINAAFGFILVSIDSEEQYRYFYPHNNNMIFQSPITLSNEREKEDLKQKLEDVDYVENCTSHRSNTKWRFFKLTNLTIFATFLRDVPLGCKTLILPPLLMNNRWIQTLLKVPPRYVKQYSDNLCLIRAVAYHEVVQRRISINQLEIKTSEYFNSYLNMTGKPVQQFRGVPLKDIPTIEDIGKLNIFVYDADISNNGSLVGSLVRRSVAKYNDTVNLLRHGRHICYVKKLNCLFRKYQCSVCGTFLKKSVKLRNHQRNCSLVTKDWYPGGVYTVDKTIFEELEEIGNITIKQYGW